MGQVIPIGDSNALTGAILEILDRPGQYHKDPEAIARVYTPGAIAAVYETLFEDLLEKKRKI